MSRRAIRKRRHHRGPVLGITRNGELVFMSIGGTPIDTKGFVRWDYSVTGRFTQRGPISRYRGFTIELPIGGL